MGGTGIFSRRTDFSANHVRTGGSPSSLSCFARAAALLCEAFCSIILERVARNCSCVSLFSLFFILFLIHFSR